MRELSILLLAAGSGEGSLGEMLDPRLRAMFAEAGIRCQACYLADLQPEHLDLFHAVVLLRTPVPQHPLDEEAMFREKSAWLHAFVERGGGLFLMFTECYGKTESTLNELCAPWGMRFYFNRLVCDATVPAARFPRLHESVLLPAVAAPNSCLALPFRELLLVTEGGHGTQHLTCVPESGSPWEPILRGGPHIVSRGYGTFYINTSNDPIDDPILCAAREAGRGRLLAFPGSAPFWLTNSHIWRFQGLLQEQRERAGFRFFRDALRWLADTERGRRLAPDAADRAAASIDPAWLDKPERYSFRPVGEEDQRRIARGAPQKIWLGGHGLERAALEELIGRLARDGYRAAFPLGRYADMSEERWPALQQLGRDLTRPETFLCPGYELSDDEGVVSAVVSPTALPRHTLQYPNSTLLENVWIAIFGCLSILRHPLANRIPPQRYGGYNLIEWDGSDAWVALYRRLAASKYFISPVAFNAARGGDSLNTWVLVPEGRSAFDMLRTNRHATFVTDGPVLERFDWSGPGLMDDEWEGYWYGYVPGEEAEVNVRVRSEQPLSEVTLYDGEDVLARFAPGEARFATRLRLRLWRDACLHLTATDQGGRRLYATFPLYTRNLRFWGHVGSDQMNNYVNAMTPAPNGFLGVGHQLYDMFGFVTFGAAWGDYVRMSPSLSYAEFMPRQEVSGIIGSFNVHHPSALLTDSDGRRRYLNDHRRVFSFCGADAQVFRSDVAGEHVDNDQALRERWHGRDVTPTRLLLPVPGAACHDDYVVWRWAVNQPILVEVRKRFQLDPGHLQEPWFTFASNSHWNIPGLFIRSMRQPDRFLLAKDMTPASVSAPPGKEWDNSYYLRMAGAPPSAIFSPGAAGDLEIGAGGAGTFGFMPLGAPRELRALLWATPKELQVFFQCRLTESERLRGVFTIAYLMSLDATETEGTPFDSVLQALARASAGLGADRRLAVELDVSGASFPLRVDVDELFPACAGEPLYLAVRGMPPGIVEWRDMQGRLAFASQPLGGRSWHQIPAAGARCFTLAPGRTWDEI